MDLEDMKKHIRISDLKICVRGGGDIASGVSWRLHQCGFRVFITEIDHPMAVRRKVAFCEAVWDGHQVVQGVDALLIHMADDISPVWDQGKIPVLVDPDNLSRHEVKPDVVVDAILAKKNMGTALNNAPLVIALGPGFEAGIDAHFVIETKRGHDLGRVLTIGPPAPNTGEPGPVLGITSDRVLRSPADGLWQSRTDIGEFVRTGDIVGSVADVPVQTLIDGVVRGLIKPGITASRGLKIGDIDPRGIKEYCWTISEKALAIAGGVL